MNKELINIFRETQAITKTGQYTLDGTLVQLPQEDYCHAVYIPPEVSEAMLNETPTNEPRRIERCSFSVSPEDSFAAARTLAASRDYCQDSTRSRILVLNSANSVSPGGGVRSGARAQEEDLCRKSTLYASLTSPDAAPYYTAHAEHYSPLASHAMLLSPNVAIFRGDDHLPLHEAVTVSVLTCAAPIAYARGSLTEREYEELFYERIRRILIVAAHYRYSYLILGAWGCGAFGNDAKQVAALFEKAFRTFRYGNQTASDLFRSVVFAVRSSKAEPTYNYNAFWERFHWFYKSEDMAEMVKNKAIRESPERVQDRIRGCLIGGAVGDALGYPVEFLSYNSIVAHYGKYRIHGITDYKLDQRTGEALFSDDTQMTLFTANGILVNETGKLLGNTEDKLKKSVYEAYLEWWRAQTNPFPHHYKWRSSWLMDVPSMYKNRGPGRTCMSALGSGECGSIKHPLNNSSGNGGLMRVAPYGCYFREMPETELVYAAAESTAITHGNSLGYIPSGMMALIVRKCICENDKPLPEIVLSSFRTTEEVFAEDAQWSRFAELIEKAISLTSNSASDLTNIRTLGRGTTGDSALAISLYCALKYEHDFSAAVIAAVNHDGDSDSTGAVTGNLLGAYLGLGGIEEKWLKNLELKWLILNMADDLALGVPGKDEPERLTAWREKYVNMKLPRNVQCDI